MDDERQERREERDATAARHKQDQGEIENLRSRCERLEAERVEIGAGVRTVVFVERTFLMAVMS